MSAFTRRDFLKMLAAVGAGSVLDAVLARADALATRLAPGSYHPGRIENEYSLFLAGEQEALRTPPTVSAVTRDQLTAHLGVQSSRLHLDDQLDGWRLLAITNMNGIETAAFEKHATYRGAIAYVTESGGVIAYIPKQIGDLSSIRPRPTNAPHGVKFERVSRHGPDTAGQYVLNSAEDPCYENVAALGPEYVGWTLVANEESGPKNSLYLDAIGRSRELADNLGLQGLWAPDAAGSAFNPAEIIFQNVSDGASSSEPSWAVICPWRT